MWRVLVFLVIILLSISRSSAQTLQEDNDLSRLATEIWRTDPNRLQVGKDLSLDWQGTIDSPGGGDDVAPMKLCTIKSNALKTNPVYSAFIALLDNYEHRVGFSEVETARKTSEVERFLDAVLKTTTMKRYHAYLSKLGLVSPKPALFKDQLRTLWFKPYRRVRHGDSSPFEHVFIGETKRDMVLGMHNWVTFCMNEAAGVFNYYGHRKPYHRDPDFKRSLRFIMHKSFTKSIGTLLFGASVEFELGLYTTVFLKGQKLFKNQRIWPLYVVNIGDTRLLIQCHAFAGNRMGSCYFK